MNDDKKSDKMSDGINDEQKNEQKDEKRVEKKVLMELTEDHLETGLRGVPVGYCTTSSVDPVKGLFYVGQAIEDIAEQDPEDVIFLLINKRQPNAAEKAAFSADLRKRQHVDQAVYTALKGLPKDGHPMKWMLAGLTVAGMVGVTGDWKEDCLNVIAQIPVISAAIFRIRSGWGEPIEPSNDLGYMENFVSMLGVPGLTAQQTANLTHMMRVFDVVHLDHGGGNLSTFVGKAVASGHADLYESLVGAMAALAGPLHGRANQECLEFIQSCVRTVNGKVDRDSVQALLKQKLANKEIIYGFGHAVLRVEDPRARALRKVGDVMCPNDTNFKMVKLLAEVGPEVLKTNPKISNPYPNVDSASGSLLMYAGLTDPEFYTVLFGLSRCVGIAVQIVYERTEARGGKGTPIIRPKYIYSPTGTANGAPTGASAAG